jgi:hypothetical protein
VELRGYGRRFSFEPSVSNADDPISRCLQGGIASSVALERGAMVVKGPAVDLDN